MAPLCLICLQDWTLTAEEHRRHREDEVHWHYEDLTDAEDEAT